MTGSASERRDDNLISARRLAAEMPRTLYGLVRRVSGRHQIWLAGLSILFFVVSTAPLELQRRIVNAAVHDGNYHIVLILAAGYLGLGLMQGLLKLSINVYGSWMGEKAVRWLRTHMSTIARDPHSQLPSAKAGGVEISMILSEADPIGGFVGSSVSVPLVQGGVLISVFGYMVYLQPLMGLVSLVVFVPQFIFVPLMQGGINRRVSTRIETLRNIGGALVDLDPRDKGGNIAQGRRVDQVFDLNMGIYKLKFSLNFLMNFLHEIGVASIWALGGYYVIRGQIDVGTVVAFVSGLSKINDPWNDLVDWFRDFRVTNARYNLIVESL